MLKKLVDLVQVFYKSLFRHTPNEKLNDAEIEKIKMNGLIHFCDSKNVKNILQEGVKGGLRKPMKSIEKKYTWFYIYDSETYETNKRIVHSKGNRKSYDAYIIIKELTDEQMNMLRIRRKFDNAVIYPDTLQTEQMKAYHIENSEQILTEEESLFANGR